MNILLDRKVEHLADLGGGADEGAAEREAAEDQGGDLDFGEGGVADLDKVAVGLEEIEVVAQGYLVRS